MNKFKRILVYDGGDFQITLHELFVMIIIVAVMNILGFKIFSEMRNNERDEKRKYSNSIIATDENKFDYYRDTKVGYIFVDGVFNTSNTVTSPYLKGSFNTINIKTEKYVKETYTTTEYYTDSKGNRKSRKVTKTRKVWKSRGNDTDGEFSYMFYDLEIPYSMMDVGYHTASYDMISDAYKDDFYGQYIYLDGRGSFPHIGDERIRVSYIENSFSGCMFMNTAVENLVRDKDTLVLLNTNSDDAKDSLMKPSGVPSFLSFVWTAFSILLAFFYGFAENRYLE